MMISYVRSYMGTSFEGVASLQVQIIRAKRNKCKELLSLENINHVETYVIRKRDKGNV